LIEWGAWRVSFPRTIIDGTAATTTVGRVDTYPPPVMMKAMPRRPNFLIVMAEHFTSLQDPNYQPFPMDLEAITRLATQATRFERAYCAAPVCGPSRLSFLTGRLVCNHGGYDNGSVLASHVPTFGHVLTRGGYRTAMCGRMHIHGLDQHVGFEQRPASEIINPDLCQRGDRKGPAVDISKPPTPAPDDAPPTPTWSDSPIFKHDEYVTQQACQFLRGVPKDDDDRPFCLVAGYHAAHPGSYPNPAHAPLYDKYIQRDLPIAEFSPRLFDQLPQHARWAINTTKASNQAYSHAQQRHHMALALAATEYFDQQVGQLLNALDNAGLADDTIVIVTADHGEGLGRHGLWGKMYFYEHAQRIPLYIRVPGRDAQVVRECVSLVDILPTLADFADCDIPAPTDGKSLRPLIEQTRPERDDAVVFSEYHGYRAPCDMYMVVKGKYKYCHYLTEQDELYDLASDPDEVHNLADDSAYAAIASELMAEIHSRVDIEHTAETIAEQNDQRDLVCEAYEASDTFKRMQRERHEAFRAALNEPWWDGGEYLYAEVPSKPSKS
jgi:choline-sulfatase